jgi:transcription initiation factor TFIID subunit 13
MAQAVLTVSSLAAVAQMLYAHGDVKNPLPETVRVLDEMVTDFIQGLSFEAVRAAQYAGRQKVKFEDFEFAMRKNPSFLGKVQETFQRKAEIDAARKTIDANDDQIIRDAEKAEKAAAKAAAAAAAAGRGRPSKNVLAAQKDEEELGEEDDDADAEADALGSRRR